MRGDSSSSAAGLVRKVASQLLHEPVEQVAGAEAVAGGDRRSARRGRARAARPPVARPPAGRSCWRRRSPAGPERRRRSASSASPGPRPLRASTTSRITSASSIAARACAWTARASSSVVGEVDAAGVDQVEAEPVPLALERPAVAGHARLGVGDRLAAAGQPVDQRALARRSGSRPPPPPGGGSARAPMAGSRRPPSGDPPLPRQRGDPLDDLIEREVRWCRCSTASSAARSGAVPPAPGRARPGLAIARSTSSTGSPVSPARRRARSSRRAVRKTLSGESGLTTVPMSRPSAT